MSVTTNLSKAARTEYRAATRQYAGSHDDYLVSKTEANLEALRKANQEVYAVKAKYRID